MRLEKLRGLLIALDLVIMYLDNVRDVDRVIVRL